MIKNYTFLNAQETLIHKYFMILLNIKMIVDYFRKTKEQFNYSALLLSQFVNGSLQSSCNSKV